MPRDGIPLVLAFCIHGVRLKACVDTPVLAQRLRGILGPFETEATFGTDFSLDIRHEADPFLDIPPDGMQEYWRGTLPDGPPVVCYRGSSERETLLPGLARMRLTPRGADVWVAPGADWCLNLGCLLPALCDLLARRGHYVVHAATLRARSGTGKMPVPPALLLCGPGGVGKTTAALALARAGLQLLTDDATFLWCTPGDAASPEAGAGKEESRTRTRTTTRTIGDCRLPTADCRPSLRPGAATGAFHVWGLPRACKVHRHTVELMPWLRPFCECSEPVADEYLV
ncbi:MAG: hypothetical protein FJ290_26635, partial [Planctomycetes bacterium]|nr:hypothetical protein [Planctomycetota bacterium]